MASEIKTLDGIMNLDDSNDIFPMRHHKEARNGVFKGNAPEMHFTAIRGNSKIDNSSIVVNDCKVFANTAFIPNCFIGGDAVYIGKCDLVGTAVYVVDFSLSVTCALNDGVVVANGLTGGGGVYQISNVAYFTEAAALAGNSYVDATTFTFNNMPDGILWFAVRDKNNPSNKRAKSISISCNGTSTECRVGFTVQIGAGGSDVYYFDCCGNQKNVLLTQGTHTINDCTLVGSISSPDSGLISFTYLPTTCTANTTPNWVSQGYTTCLNCTNYTVERDTNPCSATYLKYRAGTTILNTAPASGSCNYDANYSVYVGMYHFCSGGVVYGREIYQNSNPCFTGNQFKAPSTGVTYATNPANDFPNVNPNIVSQGYYTCAVCVNYLVYRDINECSPTYGRYYVNGQDYGTSAPLAVQCTNDPNYNIQEDGFYYTCASGTLQTYEVYRNSNACFTGAQWRTSNGLIFNFNPVNNQSDLNPNWVNRPINQYYECDYATFTMYYQQIDTNPYSCTYNQTRRGGVWEYNSATCGYTPPNNYRYTAIRCYDGFSVNIISATQLIEGATYSTTSSGLGSCYSNITPNGTTTDAPTTYYLLSTGDDCGNNDRCIYA